MVPHQIRPPANPCTRVRLIPHHPVHQNSPNRQTNPQPPRVRRLDMLPLQILPGTPGQAPRPPLSPHPGPARITVQSLRRTPCLICFKRCRMGEEFCRGRQGYKGVLRRGVQWMIVVSVVSVVPVA